MDVVGLLSFVQIYIPYVLADKNLLRFPHRVGVIKVSLEIIILKLSLRGKSKQLSVIFLLSFRYQISYCVVCFPDINECETDNLAYRHNCHVNASCTNTHGSFRCTCISVYTGDGVTCTGTMP